MKTSTTPTRFTGPRVRHRRVCAAGKAILNDATYAAFARSNRGRYVMKELRAIKAGVISNHTVDKLLPRGQRGTLNAHLYLQEHIGDLLEGRGTVDTLGLLHSWMGHMLYCCVHRRKAYKRGHIERAWLDHSIRQLCAGRRATFSAWLRYQRTARVGFAGLELTPFKEGCAEGFFVAERISKSELQAADEFADAKAARQGLTLHRLEVQL